MAEMIPASMDNKNPQLGGERMTFDWFSSDLIKGVVMHSLLQKNHKRKLIAEIDFLYISKRGILCVEVKGGKSIFREAGKWFCISKAKQKHQIKNPFIQASDCAFALRDYLTDVYGKHSEETKIVVGYAVVFPECIFTGKGNDLFTEVMFDCSKNLNEFNAFLESAFDFWEQKIHEKIGNQSNHLTDAQIKKLTNLLRGDFSAVPSINLKMQHTEQKLIQLTEEQFDAVETINMNNRAIVIGGAGTGKTLLAIEKARKSLAENKRVAFICFNKNIAKVVCQTLNADTGICCVDTYHSFINRYLKTPPVSWPEAHELAKLFLTDNYKADEFDCLIIDEAQDLMHIDVWDSFNKFIRGGMKKGNWVLFLDPNQNLFNTTEEYNFAMEYLQDAYSPAIINLTLNCRNTEQIGKLTTQITKMPPAKHMKAFGPDVVISPFSTQKDLLRMLKGEITTLLNGGILPKDIVILSKYRLENSQLAGVDSICNLKIKHIENISDFLQNSLNYFTVHSFKGLEANIVFLIDINGFETLRNRTLNYVAMTRAKIILFAFYSTNAHDEYLKVKNEA
jgi:DNA polymerase III delta prime subunit